MRKVSLDQRPSFLIVTESHQHLLRGVDYRSREGIDLLIAHPLMNKRMLTQCLGRVGRGTDKCSRFVIKGMELLDHETVNKIDGALWKATQDLNLNLFFLSLTSIF